MPANRIATLAWLGVVSLAVTPALAKNSKPVVPQYILDAHTIAVIIDPGAGRAPEDPNANQIARQDVEAALQRWGRFTIVLDSANADLVIVVRRSRGKLAERTVADPRQNSPIADISRSDSSLSIGAQSVPPNSRSGPTPNPNRPAIDPREGAPQPQIEIGNTEDAFLVFEGQRPFDPDEIPGWRWIHQNGLKPHSVPAVDEFRKALEAAQKAAAPAAQQKPGHP